MGVDEPGSREGDVTTASPARMYDYFLGGSHHGAVDRELAERVIAADPQMVPAIRQLRSFVRRAVLACVERGVDQFLDLGSGIPTVDTVHELARRHAPGARVAYVDHEAVAVRHSRELLRDVDGVTVSGADLRDADAVLGDPAVTAVLDLTRPVAVLALGVLHFLPEEPETVLAPYRAVLVPGGALALNHISDDVDDPALAASMRARAAIYRDSSQPPVLRDRRRIAGLLDGLDIAAPGVVDISSWRPDGTEGPPAGVYGGVGFVPQP